MHTSHLITIAEQFEIEAVEHIKPYGNGLINETFLVTTIAQKYILQRLHPFFGENVLYDTYAVTEYLAQHGILTPRIVTTKDDKLFVSEYKDGTIHIWRLMTFIPGTSYEGNITPEQAYSAGKLLGTFHETLRGFNQSLLHILPYYHDVPRKITKMKKALSVARSTKKYETLHPMAKQAIAAYKPLLFDLIDYLPRWVIHGDLKISNVRFSPLDTACAFIDPDTLTYHSIVIDLGDGARSWCESTGHTFNLRIFEQMMNGYASTIHSVSTRELRAIPNTIELIIAELAARFITDACNESYFKLVPPHKTLFEQNTSHARAQLQLLSDFQKKKESAIQIIESLCMP